MVLLFDDLAPTKATRILCTNAEVDFISFWKKSFNKTTNKPGTA